MVYFSLSRTHKMDFKSNAVQAFLFWILTLCIHEGLSLRVNESTEYKLRRELLENMDVMVRPVMKGSDVVNVSFSLTVWTLMDLESKRQMLLTNAWISQKWHNPFLVWNKDEYGGIDRIHVSPKEIWVPDIVLYNNGDKQVVQAGFTEMFKNWVVLHSDGTCTWDSASNFESRCNVEISSFPFDVQNCSLVFGSATYGSDLLRIHSMRPRDKQGYLKESVQNKNGEWEIEHVHEEIYSSEMAQRPYSTHTFSFARYTLEIKRKPLYYVMLLIIPCVLCTMLVLMSFKIPPENGERIGFCSTIMISVSVYLLIMADMLPEKSDTLPILGIYYTITMVEIALALMATIGALSVYHSVSEPPACFKALYRMHKAKKKREIERQCKGKVKVKKFLKPNTIASETTNVESGPDATAHAPVPVDPEQRPVVSNDNELTEDDKRKIWRIIAVTCDRICFWLFLITFLSSTGYLMKYRPVLTF